MQTLLLPDVFGLSLYCASTLRELSSQSTRNKIILTLFFSLFYCFVFLSTQYNNRCVVFAVVATRKLYRRVKERENKKEMKRKLKQQKAAKKKKN